MAAARAGGYRGGMDAVRDGGGGVASARNRLLALGGRACSDAELLGLVLDGGLGGVIARERAARLGYDLRGELRLGQRFAHEQLVVHRGRC